MKTVGLITEYNPFHSGHLYHMEEAKRQAGAAFSIALMSGNFVQRGEPSVFDKYTRTMAALLAGADLVLEIPTPFSTASAREFASYGVALLTALGVDSLVFGSECGELCLLQETASLLSSETAAFQERLLLYQKQGLTYPQARARALERPNLLPLLENPNNILGIEYLQAAVKLKSPMELLTIKRQGKHYHDTALPEEATDCPPSATAIRASLRKINSIHCGKNGAGELGSLLSRLLPNVTLPAYKGAVPIFPDDLSELLNSRILDRMYSGTEERIRISDLTPDMEARLLRPPYRPLLFEARVQDLKTRQMTYTRVSRALLHLILQISEVQMETWKQMGYAPYARVLGFRRSAAKAGLLGHLKQKSAIPILTKMADAQKQLSPKAYSLLETEIRASHLYETLKSRRGGTFQNEFTKEILILP